MITKKPYEEYFIYYDFKRIKQGGRLDDDDTVKSAMAIVTAADNDDEDYPEMMGEVMPYGDTSVACFLKGGEKNKDYRIVIRIVTLSDQKFEGEIKLAVI